MNLRKMIMSSLFLSIGLILHQVMPPILFGMKPDIMLCMMFIAIAINKDYKMTILIGLVAGILTASTTTFPGGQLPNIIDKFVTANCIYLLFKVFEDKFSNQIQMIIAAIIGTLISGTVFLGSALVLVGLPGPFKALMIGVVLPSTILNAVGCSVLYNAVCLSLKRIKAF
jgi:hypothetical protein